MLEHEIQAFGQRLGLEDLHLTQDGLARLDFDGIGSFHLELAEQGGRRELLVGLSAAVPPHDDDATRRLLELCDYSHAHPFPLAAGVFSGRAILLTRVPENEVTASGLENILRFHYELLSGRI